MTTPEDRWLAAQAAYTKKIRTAAYTSSYVSGDHDDEDMEQELLVVLWECCSMYDPDRGATFNTFFWMRARQRIGQLKARAGTQSRGGGMDIIHVDLDDEMVAREVGAILATPSAEQEFIIYEGIRERLAG